LAGQDAHGRERAGLHRRFVEEEYVKYARAKYLRYTKSKVESTAATTLSEPVSK
jgi:hypothetical protein